MAKKYFVALFLFFSLLLAGQPAWARDPQDITDWYIQNFETNIVVNKDSSLLITENIIADCGDLYNKHGIFRVLPTKTKTDKGTFKTPVELVNITDFNGQPYKYQTIKSSGTITWKIGDPDVTVSGVNYYRIIYKVKNAVRFINKDFDELYWNLLGAFWDIGTNNFSAKISFPPEITSQNTRVDYYTGYLGSKDKSLATYFWDDNNVLNFQSASAFQPREGLTASITFPKNIFAPYKLTFLEQYGDYFAFVFFLIPIGVFLYAFSRWRTYGKDPKMKKPIPPEFGIPDNITPMQMGMVLSHGLWKNNFVTAAIIDLAVRKFITIEQTEEKVLFFTQKSIILKKNGVNYDLSKVTSTEKTLLEYLFSAGDEVNLTSLKNNFYVQVREVGKLATKDIADKGWLEPRGSKYAVGFILLGFLLIWFSFWTMIVSVFLFMSILVSGGILVAFGFVMPKRTQAGVDLLFKIKGFEIYMRQAENYRQQFYEKENIFDKFLPYAIVFGIAELWAQKMQLIYGEDYFKNYHPVWLAGAAAGSFNLSSFTSQLNSITSSISSTTSSSSGAGGGGGSGGGGGGGGGGGW
ncbi:MAG: DUF2207 domain-containing protein [Candidatus Staskawiczbacteria bacterium]|nr:DUF2207 domain-containing protein [Candidatus Staskawiczbacteria bacterium]